MSAFYDEMAQVAQELLAEFGRDIEIFRDTGSVRNKVTGAVTPGSELRQQVKAAILPASQGTVEAFDVRFMSDVSADLNLRFAIVSTINSTFMPKPGDRAVFDGVSWQVLGCTPINVDGTPVIYSVGFREF